MAVVWKLSWISTVYVGDSSLLLFLQLRVPAFVTLVFGVTTEWKHQRNFWTNCLLKGQKMFNQYEQDEMDTEHFPVKDKLTLVFS